MNLKSIFLLSHMLLGSSTWLSAQVVKAGGAVSITGTQGVPQEDKAMIHGGYQVSNAGFIRIPQIGPIHAAGMTTAELARSIENAYKAAKVYQNPIIKVELPDSGDLMVCQLVHVMGQVKHPGKVCFTPGLNLQQAVTLAGGVVVLSSQNHIVVFRNGKQQIFDLNKPEDQRFELKANDVIAIPDKIAFSGAN